MSGSQVFVRAWKADRQVRATIQLVAGHLCLWSFSLGEASQFD